MASPGKARRLTKVSRSVLVAELQRRMVTEGFPRLVVGLIVALAGGAGFLFSVAALHLGMEAMGPRYALAVAGGYGVFLILVRVWIEARRHGLDPGDIDLGDFPSLPSRPVDVPKPSPFAGGSSGGGGASNSWEPGVGRSPVESGERLAKSVGVPDLDSDELAAVLVAVCIAAASALAIAYVIYMAPVLLAEVALDAALVSGIFRRLRREDVRYWLGSVLRKTGLPALGLASLLMVLGTVLQRLAPDAHSIGQALESVFR